jgi:hypothetical protein
MVRGRRPSTAPGPSTRGDERDTVRARLGPACGVPEGEEEAVSVDPRGLVDLVRRFEEGPRALREAWDRVPAAARQWRPGPGKWSAHEVVLHCADASVVGHGRVRYLLAEKEPTIVGWDQDVWPVALDYHAHPIDPAFAAVDAAHANTVPLLRRLTPEELARKGNHTELGPMTVEGWLRYNAEHLHVHARQIDRNVLAFRAGAGAAPAPAR